MIDNIGIQNPIILLTILAALFATLYYFRTQENIKEYKKPLLLRTITVTLILIAISQPYIITDQQTQTTQEANVLLDQSPSSQLIDVPEEYFEEETFNVERIGNEQQYHTQEQIQQEMEPNQEYILISDHQFQNNQEFQEYTSDNNITLNTIDFETTNQNSVWIEGSSTTFPDVENTYTVYADSTGEIDFQPELTINGETQTLTQETENTWQTTHTFENPGYQQIKAQTPGNEETTEYYKTVNVVDQPTIGHQNIDNELKNFLSQYFELQETTSNNIGELDSIVAAQTNIEQYQQQITEGTGLTYIGDDLNQEILPINNQEQQTEEPPETFDTSKIALVIDSSISTEGDDLRRAQKIALNLVENLPAETEIALITYQQDAYLLNELKTLEEQEENLKTNIRSLEAEGPTYHHTGINAGNEILQGEGDIVMITDGLTSRVNERRGVPEDTIEAANNTEAPVTIVDRKTSVNPDFLQQIANLSDGRYIPFEAESEMNFLFETRETEYTGQPISTNDPQHPVIDGRTISAYVEPYHSAERTGANTALTVENMPYLSTWNYGLGPVAMINDPETDLERLRQQEPGTIISTILWTLQDNIEQEIQIDSASKPNQIEIRSQRPLNNSQYREGQYIKTKTPGELGIHSFNSNKKYAYNYHLDLRSIGINAERRSTIQQTDGNIYQPDQEQTIIEETTTTSEEQITERTELSIYIIAVVILLMLIEIWIRKTQNLL